MKICALFRPGSLARGAPADFRIYLQFMDFANRGVMAGDWKRPSRWMLGLCLAACSLTIAWPASAQQAVEASTTPAKDAPLASTAAGRFADRADRLTQVAPVDKGEWGLLVMDAATGDVLYEKNPDKYFVPASNMKLLTTALALDKLGPDYLFRTTVETNGTLSPEGKLTGDLILVGRGDPNLSNRKYPFDSKEEFDGPPEKVLAELADLVTARGVKEISGDIVGDDSYFPRCVADDSKRADEHDAECEIGNGFHSRNPSQ